MRRILICILSILTLTTASSALNSNVDKALDALRQGNFLQSFELIKKAAAVNDVVAQFYLAQCYEHGIGTESDYKNAFLMYRRAAERGFSPAMLILAQCYYNGIGVEINNTKGDDWQARYLSRPSDTNVPDLLEIYASAGNVQDSNVNGQEENNKVDNVPNPSTKPSSPSKESRRQQAENKNSNSIIEKSDVDINIPTSKYKNENYFAFIFANENYQDVASVPNAINDGESVYKYCLYTLGIPETNIHFVKDATLNNMRREINMIKKIAEAYNGNASFIFYYAGHGIPDEKTHNSYIMPVDGYGSDITTCYSLSDIYDTFGVLPSKKNVIMLDACFSGATRQGEMLASARGVAIKSKQGMPTGNTVVISSAQGDETAYPYKEKKHGLFTYFLLKKLQESHGETTIGTLIEYLKDNVGKKSIVVNGKSQTPTVIFSQSVADEWNNWKLK